jgi:hypothetical protein
MSLVRPKTTGRIATVVAEFGTLAGSWTLGPPQDQQLGIPLASSWVGDERSKECMCISINTHIYILLYNMIQYNIYIYTVIIVRNNNNNINNIYMLLEVLI